VIKALDMAYEQRGRPQNVLFHSDQAANMAAEASVSDCGNIASSRA
jgi:putative transposase